MSLTEIYIDGASKGNPGLAGIGIIICREGRVMKNVSSYIGNATNNVAEYRALIRALEEGQILKADHIKVNTDSQLLCNQINKVYKVKNPNILSLYNQALHLINGFKDFRIEHICREENRGADKLATAAINKVIREKRL